MLGVVMGIIRKFFMALDMVVYTLIQTILQLILDLSNVSIFSKTSINNFAKRIYVILGLVMVFKLMISFIQIIINPDKMTDKEQGIGNILGRVAFSLVLIVMVPSIFDLAREIQGYILPVIPKVILGAETTVDVSDPNQMDSVARDMTLYSFLPFFTYDNSSCNEGQILGTGTSDQIGNLEVYDMGSAFYNVNNEADCSTSEFGYRYKYSFFISTLVGAYEVFVLVQIAVSIAIRAIKLSICEFVAPIPIASYIDPKSSKQTFSKWVSTTLKTYADLFVRLIILYFVIFVFMTIFKTENIAIITKNLGGSVVRTSLVILFIIVGLLQFVKSAPKFISDLLGIPEGGGDIMGMFKGEGFGALTAIPGALAAGVGNIANARRTHRGFIGGTASALGGLASGLYHGVGAAMSGKSAKEIWNTSTQTAFTNRNRRAIDKANGLSGFEGFMTRQRVKAADWAQMQDAASLDESRRQALENMDSAASGFTNAVVGRIPKSDVGYRNGKSGVIDSIASHIEQFARSTGAKNVRDFLTNDAYASQRTPAMERFMRRFTFDANTGNYIRNANGHAKFATGRNFGANDLQSIAESLQGTELGGFMGGDYLRNLSNSEIRDVAYMRQSVKSDGSDYKEFYTQRDIETSRSNYENVFRANLSKVGQVIDANGKTLFTGDFDKDYTDNSAIGFGAVSDPIKEAQNVFNTQLANEENAIIRAARESNAARSKNNN